MADSVKTPENFRDQGQQGKVMGRFEFMQRVAAGNASAQGEFIQLIERRVRTVAMAVLGHTADAEDATQNILLELLRSAKTYRGDGLLSWTDRIAVRTAARHARKRRVRAAATDFKIEPDEVACHSDLHAEHDIPRPLLEYLAELPEARRTALVMRHLLEYSVQEIAELTDTSPNTVKDRLLQARAQLRRSVRRETSIGRPVSGGS